MAIIFGQGNALDQIKERTADAGVTIDGVLLKDGALTVDALNIDDISEKTAAHGVEVEDVLIKDTSIYSTDDCGSLKVYGGQNSAPMFYLFGKNHGNTALKGAIHFKATNVAGNNTVTAIIVDGMSDTPYVEIQHTLKSDTISEKTADAGVTIDSLLIKDGYTHIPSRTPSSATDTGAAGQTCYDSSYFYICTATNTWRRIAHATW